MQCASPGLDPGIEKNISGKLIKAIYILGFNE